MPPVNEEVLELRLQQIHDTMSQMADHMEKLTEFMVETTAQRRADEQKMMRIHDRLDRTDHHVSELDQSLIALTTEVIPELERDAAIKGSYWKLVAAISLPLAAGAGTLFMLFTKLQETQNAAMLDILKKVAESAGG